MSEDRRTRSGKASPGWLERGFFDGFAWSIPVAFAPAIAAFRFEQGDVLYPDRRAYAPLKGRIPRGLKAIQVLLPPRSGRSAANESDGDRRLSNWQSEVTIDLIDLAGGRSESRVISQGRLLTTVWQGDERWLEPGDEEPPLPRSARELQRRLEDARAAFDARQQTKRGVRFIFVVDLANDASRIKARNIEDALTEFGDLESLELSLRDAGIAEAAAYLPTVVIRGLVVPDRTSDEVLPTLRACLYGGQSDEEGSAGNAGRAREEGATSDRFSIGRHGLLDDIGEGDRATR